MTVFKRVPYYVRQMKKGDTVTKKVSKFWFKILSLFTYKYKKISPNIIMVKNYKPKK